MTVRGRQCYDKNNLTTTVNNNKHVITNVFYFKPHDKIQRPSKLRNKRQHVNDEIAITSESLNKDKLTMTNERIYNGKKRNNYIQ